MQIIKGLESITGLKMDPKAANGQNPKSRKTPKKSTTTTNEPKATNSLHESRKPSAQSYTAQNWDSSAMAGLDEHDKMAREVIISLMKECGRETASKCATSKLPVAPSPPEHLK